LITRNFETLKPRNPETLNPLKVESPKLKKFKSSKPRNNKNKTEVLIIDVFCVKQRSKIYSKFENPKTLEKCQGLRAQDPKFGIRF
jgi:hypothetical protein